MPCVIEPAEVFSPEEIKRLVKWIERYESPLLFFLHPNAEQVFGEFDRMYFERVGISEAQYVSGLVDEIRQQASLAFTEMPNGGNETAFHYPEEQRQQAYKAYEARDVARCAKEENMLRFKAYVARRMDLCSVIVPS